MCKLHYVLLSVLALAFMQKTSTLAAEPTTKTSDNIAINSQIDKNNMTFDAAIAALKRGDTARAIQIYTFLAEQGNTIASLSLGKIYYEGIGIPINYIESEKWYMKATEGGNAEAKDRLSQVYFDISLMYDNGIEGFAKNTVVAMDYLKKSALLMVGPSANSASMLSLYYEGGHDDIQADWQEFARWTILAAELGDAEAEKKLQIGEVQLVIGNFYKLEEPPNLSEAAKWYRKAADQNIYKAMTYLGEILHNGKGIVQDYREASQLMQKAAEHGEATAQQLYGMMYMLGHGVQQDNVQALKWLTIAASKSNEPYAGNMVQMLQRRMSPEQVQKSQQLVSEWGNVQRK